MLDLTICDRESGGIIPVLAARAGANCQLTTFRSWNTDWQNAPIRSNGWWPVNLAVFDLKCLVNPQLFHLLFAMPSLKNAAVRDTCPWWCVFSTMNHYRKVLLSA
eukprot:COSAG02_NODE_15374_length_1176_cov_1.611885_2_plen_105_part_00